MIGTFVNTKELLKIKKWKQLARDKTSIILLWLMQDRFTR